MMLFHFGRVGLTLAAWRVHVFILSAGCNYGAVPICISNQY